MPALSGRAHVNRFLRGNHFSSLNVINLNSPLVKLLPIINMEQLVILIECGILGGCHSRSEPPSTQLSPGEARPPSPAAPSCWEARSFRNLDGGGAFACGPALPVGQAPKNSSHKDTRFRHQRPSGWRRLLPGSRGGGIQNAFFGFYWGFFWGNYKKFRIHSGTCSSLNEFPSVSPPPKKYRLVQYSGFYCV